MKLLLDLMSARQGKCDSPGARGMSSTVITLKEICILC